MTNLRQAAEMALKDLTRFCHAQAYDTVEALRQALAQRVDAVNTLQERVDETEKRKHEPVAWVYNGILHEFDPSEFATGKVTPLYTAPPKREWIDLTNQEIEDLEACFSGFRLYRALEAKFKEKNS